MLKLCRVLTACLAGLQCAVLAAHDVWLEPSDYRPDVNRQVEIVLKVGTFFHGDPLPNIPEWYSDFIYRDRLATKPVLGNMGRDPAGYFWVKQAGPVSVAYISRRELVELPAPKFHQYLEEEGLEKIITMRERAGQASAVGREYYSRCAKTLIQVGEGSDADVLPPPYRCPLELVLLESPYALSSGDRLPARLLYRGEPLPGAQVVAFTRKTPDQRFVARTDAQGRLDIDLDRPGEWLIKAVEMVPIDEAEADWESFWASLTFSIED